MYSKIVNILVADCSGKCCYRRPGEEPHRRRRGCTARRNGQRFYLHYPRSDGSRSAPGYRCVSSRGVRAQVWCPCDSGWRNKICWSYHQSACARSVNSHDGLTFGGNFRDTWRILLRRWSSVKKVPRWVLSWSRNVRNLKFHGKYNFGRLRDMGTNYSETNILKARLRGARGFWG